MIKERIMKLGINLIDKPIIEDELYDKYDKQVIVNFEKDVYLDGTKWCDLTDEYIEMKIESRILGMKGTAIKKNWEFDLDAPIIIQEDELLRFKLLCSSKSSINRTDTEKGELIKKCVPPVLKDILFVSHDNTFKRVF